MGSANRSTDAVLTVTYAGEPDVVHELREEGQGLTFGRDETCDVPVWSAITGRDLSRVAGRLWRMDGEIWLRNLSHHHELEIDVPRRPREAALPARRDDGFDRGAARSIPGEIAFVRGPGGCELLVRQQHPWRPDAVPGARDGRPDGRADDEATLRLPAVPDELRAVAAALCEPLLAGGLLPASYHQVVQRAGTGTIRRTRLRVARLCEHYAEHVPQLRRRVGDRMARDLDRLGVPGDPRLDGGVWRFDAAVASDSEAVARRRALTLPDYFEVAHLLVRRGLVSADDVARLDRLDLTSARGLDVDGVGA